MADWAMPLFTIVVGVALFIEMIMIVAAFVAMRRLTRRLERLAEQAQSRLFPRISQFALWADDVQPRISGAIAMASEATHSARAQIERADARISETMDQVEATIEHADEVITAALTGIRSTGAGIRRVVFSPVQSAKDLLRGVYQRFGLLRGQFHQSPGNAD